MDRSYPYSRRLASRARLRMRMAAVLATGLFGAAALSTATWAPDPLAAALPDAAPGQAAAADGLPGKLRRIYPYSVIPGGVSGKTELARVIRSDRVVAQHYAGFDVDGAKVVVVRKPRAVHVSYRKNGKIYWTARKVMLAEGETLLSEGRNELRARCANRISDLPQYPVEAHQPAMEELDNPVEVDEGNAHALGEDGLPVAMVSAEGVPSHTGQYRPAAGKVFPVLLAATPADATSGNSSYAFPLDSGHPAIAGVAGTWGSVGSRPRPGEAPSGSSDTTPVPDQGADSPATTPLPQPEPAPPAGPAATPRPDAPEATPLPPVFTPEPLPAPEDAQSGGGGTGQLPPVPPAGPGSLGPQPAPDPQPFLPQPDLHPTPPTATVEQPGPPAAHVPEPGSAWLFATSLASLAVLRRRGRRRIVSRES